MAQSADAQTLARRLETLLANAYNLPRGPLRARIRRAGRRLPSDIRRDAERIADAADQTGHPTLRMQLDEAGLHAAFKRVEKHLTVEDRREARSLSRLHWLLGTVTNLLIITALLIAILSWRGFL